MKCSAGRIEEEGHLQQHVFYGKFLTNVAHSIGVNVMSKKLKKLSLSKEVISDLTAVTGGANTYDATCDTNGNYTYRRPTGCLTLCRACPTPAANKNPGSGWPSNMSRYEARPCMCNPC